MAIRNALQCERLTVAGWIVLVSGKSGNSLLYQVSGGSGNISVYANHAACQPNIGFVHLSNH